MMRGLLIGAGIAGVMASALAIVLARHESRSLFVELQQLEQARDVKNIEWGQLQLELGAWSTHGQIEQQARRELGMVDPDFDAVFQVTP